MDTDINRVIVGVNGSPGSLAALRCAYAEACRRQARLHIVMAYRTLEATMYDYTFTGSTDFCASLHRSAEDTARATCRAALGCLPEDLSITSAARPGPPAFVLTHEAAREGDLLVVGPGPTGLRRLLCGSVPAQCLRQAQCQVLVVPGPALLREYHKGIRRWNGWLHRQAQQALESARSFDVPCQ